MTAEPVVDRDYGHNLEEARWRAAEILENAGMKVLAQELREGCLALNLCEPFFVLRAQDVTAASVVDHWALINQNNTPTWKIEAAQRVADAMRKYSGPRKNPD